MPPKTTTAATAARRGRSNSLLRNRGRPPLRNRSISSGSHSATEDQSSRPFPTSSSSSSSSSSDAAKGEQEEVMAVSIPRGYRTHPYATEDIPILEGLYKPHTVTLGCVALLLTVYFAFRRDASDPAANIKAGVGLSVAMFLTFCVVHLPDGIMLRPHPAFWRFVTGVGVLYLVACVFMLFQRASQIRSYIAFFDPTVSKPLPDRSYATDCRLCTPENPHSKFKNLFDTINDDFIPAHILGYWGKAVAVRDVHICWMVSILFELVEITFQHALPNFLECWWDHLLIDILWCNAVGIFLGIKTCQFFNSKTYNWIGLREIRTYRGKIGRIVKQFSPVDWTPYEWHMFQSYKSFCYCLFLVLVFAVVDNNVFFLKIILRLPPPHYLNQFRCYMFFLLGIAAVREFYQFMLDPACRRLGTNAWLTIAILIVESLVIVKYSQEEQLFPIPMPLYVRACWIGFFALTSLWALLYFPFVRSKSRAAVTDPSMVRPAAAAAVAVVPQPPAPSSSFWASVQALRRSLKKPMRASLFVEVLFYVSFVPLLLLFLAGSPDLQWGREAIETTVRRLFRLQ